MNKVLFQHLKRYERLLIYQDLIKIKKYLSLPVSLMLLASLDGNYPQFKHKF